MFLDAALSIFFSCVFPVSSGDGIVEMLECVGLVPKSGIGFVHFGYKQFPFTKVSIIPT